MIIEGPASLRSDLRPVCSGFGGRFHRNTHLGTLTLGWSDRGAVGKLRMMILLLPVRGFQRHWESPTGFDAWLRFHVKRPGQLKLTGWKRSLSRREGAGSASSTGLRSRSQGPCHHSRRGHRSQTGLQHRGADIHDGGFGRLWFHKKMSGAVEFSAPAAQAIIRLPLSEDPL